MAPRNDSFFNRLTRLFRSGPAIQRRVKGQDYRSYYDNELIRGNYGYRAPFPFGRESSPFSVLGAYGILDRMARYSEFAEMEYSLHPDTKIATPGGYITIKELADRCKEDPDYTFIVYSYDHSKKQIVPAVGKQARQTCHEDACKITFDDGAHIIGSYNHRLLKRDGTYCEIRDLKLGDAMMPFYRRNLLTETRKDEGDGYRWIYTVGKDEENKSGWKSEHRMVAEFIAGRKLNANEVVHHKNFTAWDNRPENLEIMDELTHQRLHAEILNGKKWAPENHEWIEKFKLQHSTWMKKNNPAERQDITFPKILQWCDENSFNLYKVARAFDTDPNTIKRKLQSQGFSDFITFAKAYVSGWKSDSHDNVGINNPRFLTDITFDRICSVYKEGTTKKQLSKELGCSVVPIDNRLKENGFKSWTDFTTTYQNCKIVSIEPVGKMDLYDFTVDGYKNFATDSVISHNTPEIAAALNIMADECVSGDEKGKAFHLYSKNAEVKKALEELFYDVLNIDFNIRPWVRNLVKYGDFFLYNEIIPDIGVVNVQPIPVNELEREEGFDQDDPYSVRYKWLTRGNRYLENWQITHMRVLGNDLFLPYGTSMLEPGRRIWRQLIMMEDAMLVYRVVRSPERRVFYIDVGNVAPNDVPSYMEAVKHTLRSKDVTDRTNGRMDQRYNPVSIDEDYFIPVRGGQTGTKIETLAGGQNATATDDVKYLQQKLFAALQVPKPYLNFDEKLGAKASLAQLDVRFSRTISVLQRVIIAELNKLAMIHLYSKGFDGEDLISFELKLSNPSTVAMQQKLEALSTKFDIAGKAKETMLVDEEWIQKKILELTEDEIIHIEAGRRRDRIRSVEIEAVAVAENLPQKNTTVDPFDPSNYTGVLAGDVKKNPQTGGPGELDIDMSTFGQTPGPGGGAPISATTASAGNSLKNIMFEPDQENIFGGTSIGTGEVPVAANPFLSRAKHNTSRRVGMSGKSALSLPDFKDMLSANNRSFSDVEDKETLNLKNPRTLTEIGAEDDFVIDFKPSPVLPRDLNAIKQQIDTHFGRVKASKVLAEAENNATISLEVVDEDKLLVEALGEEIDIEEDKEDIDLSSID